MKPAATKTRRAVTAATPPPPVPDAPAPAPPDDTAPTGDQPDVGGAAMVAFMIPPDVATKLAVDGGLPPEKLHITLVYLGPDATTTLDRTEVEQALNAVLSAADEDEDTEEAAAGQSDSDNIKGVFNGVARFTATEDPDGSGTPIVLTLDAPGLDDFRADLAEGLHAILDFPEDTHGFVPHCTIQYVQGSDTDPIPLPPPPMVDVTFDSVTLAWGDPSVAANLTTMPLAGTADAGDDVEAPAPAGATPPAMGLATDLPLGATGGSVTDKPWDGSASRFNDDQYKRAAAGCDPASKGPPKTACFLPHHEPDGTINRNGVHAAAQRVGSLSGRSPDAVATAKGHLRSHYTKDLKEDPPDSVMEVAGETSEELAPDVAPATDGEGRTIPAPGPLGMFEACLVTEGVPTDEVFPDENGDMTVMGRLIPPGVLTWRTPPLPGGFAMDEMGNPADMGHANAPIACNALTVTREGDRILARGPYADNPAAGFLKAAVDNGAAIAPSIDLGASDVWDITTDADGKTARTLLSGSIAGFVVLPYEAQHSTDTGEWLTWFRSASDTALTPPEAMPETIPAEVPVAASAVVACGAESFGAPLYPPRSWFETPAPNDGEIVGPTYTDEGQVFGHASGSTCHIGIPGTCLRVSDDMLDRDFRVFHKGLDGKHRGIKTAEGDLIQVGQVTLAGGHADTRLGAADARKHYDDTDSVIANVRITWDEKAGAPWMAGAIQHTATEGQVQQMRAAGEVSVDYRELEDGRLHLIALPVVPRGGFPPMRALSAGGELKTLILTASSQAPADAGVDTPEASTPPTTDALVVELTRDLYLRRFAEEGALLASAHAREKERLGALVR